MVEAGHQLLPQTIWYVGILTHAGDAAFDRVLEKLNKDGRDGEILASVSKVVTRKVIAQKKRSEHGIKSGFDVNEKNAS